MTAPDQCCSNVRKSLSRRRPHMTQSGHDLFKIYYGRSRNPEGLTQINASLELSDLLIASKTRTGRFLWYILWFPVTA